MQEIVDSWRQMAGFIGLFLMGLVGRVLVSPEPFDRSRFAGEMILTAIGAVALYAVGVLKGLDAWQLVLLGATSSLGGLRLLEWGFKIAQAVKAIRP